MSHDTYLNGARHGWPQDHKAEDTFDLPLPRTDTEECDHEFYVEAGLKGEAFLMKTVTTYTHTTIASFDTLADAQLAAEALNNHKGY